MPLELALALDEAIDAAPDVVEAFADSARTGRLDILLVTVRPTVRSATGSEIPDGRLMVARGDADLLEHMNVGFGAFLRARCWLRIRLLSALRYLASP